MTDTLTTTTTEPLTGTELATALAACELVFPLNEYEGYRRPSVDGTWSVLHERWHHGLDADRLRILPPTSWDHLTTAQLEQTTTPGFSWTDASVEGTGDEPEFTFTYVGLYKLVDEQWYPERRQVLGTFRKVVPA